MSRNGQFAGQGNLNFRGAVSQFQTFSIPIVYNDSLLMPDSANINISSAMGTAQGLSRLIIDKLSFDGFIGDNGVVAVSEVAVQSGFMVFPNPASSTVTIRMNGDGFGLIHIIDLKGRVLLSKKFFGGQTEIETDNLENGIYLMRLITEGKSVVNKIIVVK